MVPLGPPNGGVRRRGDLTPMTGFSCGADAERRSPRPPTAARWAASTAVWSVLAAALSAAMAAALSAAPAAAQTQAGTAAQSEAGAAARTEAGAAAADSAEAAPELGAPAQNSPAQNSPARARPPLAPYRPLPPGARFEWSFEPADGAPPETVVMRVLASGPSFMIQTSLAPFDFVSSDYALFLEYKGVGVLDCAQPTSDEEIRATLEETDMLWPLRPGVSAGRFTVEPELRVVDDGGPAPDGSRAFVISEASEDGLTKMHWSPVAGALVEIEWFDGGRDVLKRLDGAARGAPDGVAGVVPAPCRRALPAWLWERLGVAF